MELVEGESLEDLLGRGETLSGEAAVERMIAVAEALRLAQGHGIVHRDLKPSNLLVDQSGAIKVADFGLAKWVAEDVKITQDGAVMGTPLYMSPEQGQGEATDHRSDIYSLGATFYHLLAGRPPFVAPTPVATVVKHVTQPVPSLRAAAPHVPDELAAIVERMMAKDPNERFPGYGELIAALEAARPRRSTPAGIWVRAMALAVDMVAFALIVSLLDELFWLAWAPYQLVGWTRWGQTPGKRLLRIQVRSLTNAAPTLRQALVRFLVFNSHLILFTVASFAVFLATGTWGVELPDGHRLQVPFGIAGALVIALALGGFAIAGFRRDRRAAHDLLAGTKVVYKLDSA
jgi:uncharacterized RDD family membrane protein YckC